MAIEHYLPVRHILQNDCYEDTPEKCGAACVQMVLRAIGVRNARIVAGVRIIEEQDALYKQIRYKSPILTRGLWSSPPQGVTKVLNDESSQVQRPIRQPAPPRGAIRGIPASLTGNFNFSILGDTSVAPYSNDPGILKAIDSLVQIKQINLISRLLIRIIAQSGVAPIIAVREDNAHWVVVNGYQVEDSYTDTPSNGEIKAIAIRNPLGRYTYRNIECEPLSSTTLEVITDNKCEENVYLQDIVSYDTWEREYLFDDWAETFVVVCDQPPQIATGILGPLRILQPRAISSGQKPKAGSGKKNKTVDPNMVACSAIKDYDLKNRNTMVTEERVLQPIKVKRLDQSDGDYFMVPVGIENRIFALINISETGEFSEATVCPENHFIAPFHNRKEFQTLESSGDKNPLIGKKIRLGSNGNSPTIRRVALDRDHPYVWRPCYESFSSLRPFLNLKLTLNGDRNAQLYIPIDNLCLGNITDKTSGEIILPSPNYLELLEKCIKTTAENHNPRVDIGKVLANLSRSGRTVLVKYRTRMSSPGSGLDQELEQMKEIICQCLKELPQRTALEKFRIKAFKNDYFMTQKRGSGDDEPLASSPPSGGGDGFDIKIDC
ncbi:MAG: hypothetical protein SF339_08590 [Blastocatellia bacterium]|nr:hypothetical protein [Blastocatellia bacterium]